MRTNVCLASSSFRLCVISSSSSSSSSLARWWWWWYQLELFMLLYRRPPFFFFLLLVHLYLTDEGERKKEWPTSKHKTARTTSSKMNLGGWGDTAAAAVTQMIHRRGVSGQSQIRRWNGFAIFAFFLLSFLRTFVSLGNSLICQRHCTFGFRTWNKYARVALLRVISRFFLNFVELFFVCRRTTDDTEEDRPCEANNQKTLPKNATRQKLGVFSFLVTNCQSVSRSVDVCTFLRKKTKKNVNFLLVYKTLNSAID